MYTIRHKLQKNLQFQYFLPSHTLNLKKFKKVIQIKLMSDMIIVIIDY